LKVHGALRATGSAKSRVDATKIDVVSASRLAETVIVERVVRERE
jgi:hypothetical protein